jgi:CheY-like chemotaxis protein/HPt (histidine-containing phosphotransfer) domain-containing protein
VASNSPADQDDITRILKARGYEVLVAQNGLEAMQQVARGPVDVVLLDMQLPMADGCEVARAVRQSCSHLVPVVAISARNSAATDQACRDAGMDAYLSKPVDSQLLLQIVEGLTESNPRNSPGMPPSTGATGTPGDEAAAPDDRSVLDFDGCMKRLGGDLELFREFVEIFCEDSPNLLETIRASAKAGDRTTLSRAAHSLRGLTANFGARGAVETARLLEEVAAGNRWHEAESAAEQLTAEIAKLHAQLKPYRRSRAEHQSSA